MLVAVSAAGIWSVTVKPVAGPPVLVTVSRYVTVSPGLAIEGPVLLMPRSATGGGGGGGMVAGMVTESGGDCVLPDFAYAVFLTERLSTSAWVTVYVAVQVKKAPGASDPAGQVTAVL